MAGRRSEMRIHSGLVLAELICGSAFIFELSRALGGNTLSWAYVFEWPVLGGYGVYMWRQFLREERGVTARPESPSVNDEAALEQFNRYLERVHRDDPPHQ